ncbi:hypothetical protein BerOc1_02966 [Pseudodesulfovibrio hydrargyri]|uniref:HTH iclR-type domain-containing protein n=1 Tax=Pseudodesulfovibrio hydrargyri TaxID=2125990 RepID=A0A1J5MWS5_9BACT|nr:hypothetical protein [Pseudodesulfovibrio hydrargyri]OIQ51021.1 hypothetical protein BerOc1_02966 [Pseudodesulfovibrio hydrargyri]
MAPSDMDKLRGVLLGLSEGGKHEISNVLVFQAMALETESEKARVRRQLDVMARRSELTRIRPGHYTYNPGAARQRGEGHIRMWRAVRASTGTFGIAEIAAVSHVDAPSVGRYLKLLLSLGLVRRNGKRGASLLYSTTALGRDRRETPYPPVARRDPFADERAAMSRLARVFFEEDLYSDPARQVVVRECRAILERFDTRTEKGGFR